MRIPVAIAGATVGGGSTVSAVAVTGWGFVAVAGMVFVLALLVLCIPAVNRNFRLVIAALKACPTEAASPGASANPSGLPQAGGGVSSDVP